MKQPAFRSDIFYSVQNEDYETELAVLRRLYRGEPLRVLLVASSGENGLSLLTQPMVGQLYGVDMNPAQLHLCELRRTAVAPLNRAEQLCLLGAADCANRLALYERVAPLLPQATRTFWDERLHEIAFGLHCVGRNDVAMQDIREHLQAAGFVPLQRPLTDYDLPAWKAVYTDLMTPAYIHHLFGLPSEGLAAKIAGIAGYLGECHFHALRQPGAAGNYFLTTVFAGAYAEGDAGLPLYLQQAGQDALRQLGTDGRLHLLAGNGLEQMERLAVRDGRFDLISISNIADWMSDAQFGAAVTKASGCLNPGGAFLARTGTSSRMIQEIIAQQMIMDENFNAELAYIERGPWFRTIAAGFQAS